jgi:hypothetical protein
LSSFSARRTQFAEQLELSNTQHSEHVEALHAKHMAQVDYLVKQIESLQVSHFDVFLRLHQPGRFLTREVSRTGATV